MADTKFDNLPTGLVPIGQKPQPQIAQLEIQYAAPLTTDAMVQSVSDLPNLPIKYNYQHKRVWVKDRRACYYLDNGDGSLVTNWRQERSRTVIDKWNPLESYQEGDTVYWSKKIVRAKQDVPANMSNPLDPSMGDYWEIICGDTETLRLVFGMQTPASSVTLNTEIVNPFFQVMLGDFVLDQEGFPISDSETGLVILKNQQIVEGYVIRREDLDDETGQGYEIQFESDMQPYGLSGVINVK